MSGERNKKNPMVPKINVPPLPATDVRPDVKEALDRILPQLSKAEIQYMLGKVREIYSSGVSVRRQATIPTTQNMGQLPQTSTRDPVFGEIQDDLEKAEAWVTRGYTINYPPRALIPLREKGELGLEDLLDYIGKRLDPLLKSEKVQDQVARLIGAIADKVESVPHHG